jgi:hypothetical protein
MSGQELAYSESNYRRIMTDEVRVGDLPEATGKFVTFAVDIVPELLVLPS